MTSDPRVWVRPDGTLVVRDPDHLYADGVTWLDATEPPPEDATPLVPAATGDHPPRLRTGRKVGRTIYAQMGGEPSDDDPLVGVMDNPRLAGTVVDAVNGTEQHTIQQLREAYERGLAAAASAGAETTEGQDEALAGVRWEVQHIGSSWFIKGHTADVHCAVRIEVDVDRLSERSRRRPGRPRDPCPSRRHP